MQQLLYSSKATERLNSGDVFKIIETSARNNPARGITGFLVFARDTFLQFVEGSPEALDDLLVDLRADGRHRDLSILLRQETVVDHFPIGVWKVWRSEMTTRHR